MRAGGVVATVAGSVPPYAVLNNESPATTATTIADEAVIRAFRYGIVLSLNVDPGFFQDRVSPQRPPAFIEFPQALAAPGFAKSRAAWSKLPQCASFLRLPCAAHRVDFATPNLKQRNPATGNGAQFATPCSPTGIRPRGLVAPADPTR
jgi:hypothetical protein